MRRIARAPHWRERYFSTLFALSVLGSTPLAQGEGTAILLNLEGAIGVATAEYIIDGIEEAEDRGAELVIIRMDTPGGLVSPMRDIVKAILGSDVPVATYVSPDGARADSAGTYILLASHIAAMAPTTHLGAATPVALGGGWPGDKDGSDDKDDSDDDKESDEKEEKDATDPGSAMDKKVMNDAIAYIRGLAEAHGRNAEWAEKAVTEAATLTAAEALENNVIDLIATNQAELLQKINGRELKVNNLTVVLETESIEVETLEPSWRIKVLSAIASPEVALLLLMIGIYGLLFEGYNPGAIVPAVAGVICLLLAAYALQVLPVNYAGLALIIVGIVLIVAEAVVPSFGALGIGGIAAFIFGAIMMFDSDIPGFGISLTFVVGLALIAGLFLLWLVSYLVRLRRRGAVSGRASIIGGTGTAMQAFTGKGKIWLEGEAWAAVSRVPVEQGQEVVVRSMDGLTLEVEPASQLDRTQAEFQT
ncbi:MAG: nodulation protein NfeD [Proteobacteria bacterium]|nr:nodulation protein NfeD [Pseudomonadota bacterium]